MGVETVVTSSDSKRGAKRARVLLAAKLQTPSGTIQARLRDLSRKGALVECAATPPVGAELVFERGTTTVPARVAWAASGRVGLEFEYPIDETELLVHIGRAKEPAATPPRYGRPSIALGMSATERKLAKAWSVAVGLNLPERGD
jgi:hypothetical protein